MPVSPTLEKIFAIGRRRWAADPTLADRFGDVAALGFWHWLMTDWFEQDPELRALLPVPPPELMSRVMLDGDAHRFHHSGVDDASYLFQCLADVGFDPAQGGALLEYGSGCGRLLRFLARFADSVELHGCDVDADAVAWCRDNLEFARFERLNGWPPSPYRDGQFDAAFACSVFTHLDAELGRAWLEELHRITRPGAAVVLTTQGRPIVEKVLAGTVELRIPTADDLRADRDRLERGELAFYPYDFAFDSLPDDLGTSHGMTFFYERHVREHWSDLFEVVDYREAPSDWQDFALLRRRPS